MPLTILIPAAGRSSRMRGRDKLLEDVDGVPLLRNRARVGLDIAESVLIGLPQGDHARRATLNGLSVDIVTLPPDRVGLGYTIAAGARATQGALMILPADMPDLGAQDLAQVVAEFDLDGGRRITRGCSRDRAGHPVIFPASYLPELCQLTGDDGAKSLLRGADILRIQLAGNRAVTDLDTPEDWAAWRTARTKR